MEGAASNRGLFVSEAQRRSISIALGAAWAVSFLLFAVWLTLNVLDLVDPVYSLQLSVIAQAPSKQASMDAATQAWREIRPWVAPNGLHRADVTQLEAIDVNGQQTGNWLTIAHEAVTARSAAPLEHLARSIERNSSLPVTNISRTGEFVRVRVRPGVTTLRLSETVGSADRATHVRLQLRGPDAALSAADIVPICLLLALVLSFGAAERSAGDVHAYPRGMHPVAIFGQMLTLTLFACFLITWVRTGGSPSAVGLLVLDGAVVLGVVRWLWITRQYWEKSAFVRNARVAILALSALLAIAGVLAAL